MSSIMWCPCQVRRSRVEGGRNSAAAPLPAPSLSRGGVPGGQPLQALARLAAVPTAVCASGALADPGCSLSVARRYPFLLSRSLAPGRGLEKATRAKNFSL